jgi:hypothetical protein
MRNPTLKEKVALWQLLHANASRLQELPHLAADLARLGQLVTDVKDLEAKAGQHKAVLLENSRTKQGLHQEGDQVYQRLGFALRAQFGPKSGKLHEYGLTPQKVQRRRKGGAPGAPGVEAAANPVKQGTEAKLE